MLQFWRNVLLIFLLVYNLGCRVTKTTELLTSDIDFKRIKETVQTNQLLIQTMKCEGTISLETQNIAQSGSFTLVLRKPDSILVNIQGPFGLKVGLALITRDSFLFYNSLENKLITGSSNIENLSRIMRVELGFDDLMNLFVGGAFLADDIQKPEGINVEEEQYVFIYHSPNIKKKYFINPRNHHIQKIQFIDRAGKKNLEQTFSDFDRIGEVTIPYAIRVTMPQNKQRLSLFYSNVIINSNLIQFTINIPETAERIYW